MLIPVLLFIVGLLCLIKGGDWFVDGATGIARRFHVPELLIGATVVSIGTTLPEVMVSTTSAFTGHGEIAYGNAIGSIICNASLIAALTIAVKPGKVDPKSLRTPVLFFFVAAAFYFTATPQGLCASLVNDEILSKVKIIDLSADFRLKDVDIYEKWYKLEHKAPQYIDEAVYGLCEINRDKVNKDTRIIANPGCYTTTSILTLYPLVKEGIINPDTIIIDAKSGTSGAGRGAKVANLFCEVNESMKAYGVGTHRHTPEIEEQLGYACGRDDLKLIFTPHLVPMNRGILVTSYANLAKDVSYEDVKAAYDKYYDKEYFVRVLPKDVCPETRWVEGSNFVDVGFKLEPRTNRIIAMGALDNLVKGAAGQAVQNMNLLFGFEENEGLKMAPMFP